MSLTILAGVAGALVAVAAAALLWRESGRREPSVRNAYRALAAAALLWGAGFVDAEGMGASGTGTSLTSADLLTLLALPALGVGLFGLARASREADGEDRPAPRVQAGSAVAWLADACLLAAALFIIDWVAVLGAQYRHTGESAGTFALQAIHPIADLIALGVLLAVAVRAGRAGLAPYLALLVVAAADSLAVGARISGTRPGPARSWSRWPDSACWGRRHWSGPTARRRRRRGGVRAGSSRPGCPEPRWRRRWPSPWPR